MCTSCRSGISSQSQEQVIANIAYRKRLDTIRAAREAKAATKDKN